MKDKIVKFLKFGYVSENVIAYGIFFILVMLYISNFRWNVYIDRYSTDIEIMKFDIYVFYFDYIQNILVILLIKLVLEYFVQNQRLLKKIASSNNINDSNTENISNK